jgi:hypothetical protein
MAQRRVRPAVERSGGVNIRLPDGTTISMPTRTTTGETSNLCCFCGQGIEHTDPERIRIDVRWEDGGNQREQDWRAHRKWLLERLHEAVIGAGPFFVDD